MSPKTAGIHHVTAITGDPQRNLDFYEGVLGLRLVKKTVNFDDPGTYHLYYGDEEGSPGTILTFFPYGAGASRGRRGSGQVAAVAFSVPEASVGYWLHRLISNGVRYEGPEDRFGGERVVSFEGPDGLALELVAHPGAEESTYWEGGPVPTEHAVRGFHSVTLWEDRNHEETARLLTDTLGFRLARDDGKRFRYEAGTPGEAGGRSGRIVDVRRVPEGWRGVEAAGTVHHVAFRAAGDEEQREWQDELRGLGVTPVADRRYFRSVYFREPGGVLFEIATDAPGFATDEEVERLGEALKLPPWLESRRGRLEDVLPPLRLPRSGGRLAEKVGRDGEEPGFVHRFVPAEDEGAPTLLLLHGTGGDEDDLIPLGRELLPGAALLSPRGKVLEDGMPRFFRRLAMGVFDEEDLRNRTHELAAFVEEAAAERGFDRDNVYAVGFSNGANIAASLLLLRPDLLAGAVLLRAMVPFETDGLPDLSGTPVYLAAGQQDRMIPPENTEKLAGVLRDAGADVTLDWQPGGHAVGPAEVEAAGVWLAPRARPGARLGGEET